jgi:hypothetical protein
MVPIPSHSYTVHSSIVIRRVSSQSPHRWSALWEKPLVVPSRESNLGLPFQQAEALQTELRLTLEEIVWVGTEEAGGILDAVQGTRIRINQVSASSSFYYIPPVCGPGQGYIGQSSNGCIVQELSFGDTSGRGHIVMASERRKELCSLYSKYGILYQETCFWVELPI